MNKEHFFIELKLYLNQLSKEEQQAIISTYEQIFEEKTNQGLSEYEITQTLPSPKQIAQAILEELGLTFDTTSKIEDDWVEITSDNDYTYQPTNQYAQHDTPLSRAFQLIGLGMLNILFMFWVIILIFTLLISGWIVALVFMASPLMSLYLLGTAISTYAWFQFFASLILFGIGLLGFLIIKPITKGAFKLFKMYHKWCWTVLRGGRVS